MSRSDRDWLRFLGKVIPYTHLTPRACVFFLETSKHMKNTFNDWRDELCQPEYYQNKIVVIDTELRRNKVYEIFFEPSFTKFHVHIVVRLGDSLDKVYDSLPPEVSRNIVEVERIYFSKSFEDPDTLVMDFMTWAYTRSISYKNLTICTFEPRAKVFNRKVLNFKNPPIINNTSKPLGVSKYGSRNTTYSGFINPICHYPSTLKNKRTVSHSPSDPHCSKPRGYQTKARLSTGTISIKQEKNSNVDTNASRLNPQTLTKYLSKKVIYKVCMDTTSLEILSKLDCTIENLEIEHHKKDDVCLNYLPIINENVQNHLKRVTLVVKECEPNLDNLCRSLSTFTKDTKKKLVCTSIPITKLLDCSNIDCISTGDCWDVELKEAVFYYFSDQNVFRVFTKKLFVCLNTQNQLDKDECSKIKLLLLDESVKICSIEGWWKEKLDDAHPKILQYRDLLSVTDVSALILENDDLVISTLIRKGKSPFYFKRLNIKKVNTLFVQISDYSESPRDAVIICEELFKEYNKLYFSNCIETEVGQMYSQKLVIDIDFDLFFMYKNKMLNLFIENFRNGMKTALINLTFDGREDDKLMLSIDLTNYETTLESCKLVKTKQQLINLIKKNFYCWDAEDYEAIDNIIC
ncbi:unnamed protein product [Moneuplotes crassus]|uniref:Uncharacterized protein n=1 Tax=Euplotes crassus TaxID=5936 RepID=A0AAD1X8T7_EUPCR|nr:unnamed protein product [Moneuplotes crassus]